MALTLVVAGDVSSFDRTAFTSKLASATATLPSQITLTAQAASVIIHATIETGPSTGDDAAIAAVMAQIETLREDLVAASATLGSVVETISLPVHTMTDGAPGQAPPLGQLRDAQPQGESVLWRLLWAGVGGGTGALASAVVVMAVCVYLRQARRKRRVVPHTHAPPSTSAHRVPAPLPSPRCGRYRYSLYWQRARKSPRTRFSHIAYFGIHIRFYGV